MVECIQILLKCPSSFVKFLLIKVDMKETGKFFFDFSIQSLKVPFFIIGISSRASNLALLLHVKSHRKVQSWAFLGWFTMLYKLQSKIC